jgi:hypothetical protein
MPPFNKRGRLRAFGRPWDLLWFALMGFSKTLLVIIIILATLALNPGLRRDSLAAPPHHQCALDSLTPEGTTFFFFLTLLYEAGTPYCRYRHKPEALGAGRVHSVSFFFHLLLPLLCFCFS